jgi:hypothetical protein
MDSHAQVEGANDANDSKDNHEQWAKEGSEELHRECWKEVGLSVVTYLLLSYS